MSTSQTFPSSRAISPSVRIIERDYSDYSQGAIANTAALLGFAGKGPLNKPVRVASTEEFFTIFGRPDPTTIPSYLHYAAIDYLREGNDLYIVRTGQDDEGSEDFAKTAYVDIPSGGTHAKIVSGTDEASWTFKGTATTRDYFIRVRANGQPYVYELKIKSGTTFDTLCDQGSGTSLEKTLNAQLQDDAGFEVTHCVPDGGTLGTNGRLVFRSKINGASSSIELVSSRYNIYNGDASGSFTASSTASIETDPDTYLMLDIGRKMTYPVITGSGTKFQGSVDGYWDFSSYRRLRLQVVVQGTGDPNVDNVSQLIYLPMDENGDNVATLGGDPITTADLVDYLNGVHTDAEGINSPVGFFFVKRSNSVDIVAGYPDGTIATGGPTVGSVDAFYLTGPSAKILIRPQSSGVAVDALGYDLGVVAGTSPDEETLAASCLDPADDPDWEDKLNTNKVLGSETGSGNNSFRIQASTPGIEGNFTEVTVSIDPETAKINLLVTQRGAQAASFTGLHKNPNATKTEAFYYIENYINGYNDFIEVIDEVGVDDLPKPGTYTLGSLDLTDAKAGTNGIPADPLDQADLIIGSTIRNTGIFSLSQPEQYDIDLIAVPGVSTTSVIETLRYFCEEIRRDCMFLVDAPKGMTPTEVRKWHNGQHPLNQTKFNSNYGALYWPWIQQFDQHNQIDVWTPPSGSVLAIYARTDKVAGPWIAPAGHRRGIIDWAKDVEYTAYLADRDLLYGYDNAVNTIAKHPVDGIVLLGQKTLQRRPTALDRVSVRRMLLFAEKTIRSNARFLIFEPHDEQLRAEFIRMASAVMNEIVARRGAYKFKIQCDDTINTKDVINRNEMRARIKIEPAKAAEFIFIEFALYRTGELDAQINEDNPIRVF